MDFRKKLSLLIVAAAVGCLSGPAFAVSGLNFRAPTVDGVDNVKYPEKGEIVFDDATNTFQGLDKNDDWVPLSSNTRTEHVRFGGSTEYSNCTSDPCTIYSQSGWITSVARPSFGYYTMTITSGVFSARPTCTCSAVDIGNSTKNCTIAPTGSATSISMSPSDAGANASDGYVEVICVGPR